MRLSELLHSDRTGTGLLAGACLFVALGVSGCLDAEGDPTATLVAEETRAALLVEQDLPSFPVMVGDARAQGTLSAAMDLWLGSWNEVGPEASRLREVAYHDGSALLAESLGHDYVVAAHRQLGDVLAATTRLRAGVLPEDLGRRIERATRLHAEGAELLADGRDAEALTRVLRGSDVVRTVGPLGVAEMLIARAEAYLETVRGVADPTDVVRAERLVRGARQALEVEDWSRALRRAYYACQVLGVSPH